MTSEEIAQRFRARGAYFCEIDKAAQVALGIGRVRDKAAMIPNPGGDQLSWSVARNRRRCVTLTHSAISPLAYRGSGSCRDDRRTDGDAEVSCGVWSSRLATPRAPWCTRMSSLRILSIRSRIPPSNLIIMSARSSVLGRTRSLTGSDEFIDSTARSVGSDQAVVRRELRHLRELRREDCSCPWVLPHQPRPPTENTRVAQVLIR